MAKTQKTATAQPAAAMQERGYAPLQYDVKIHSLYPEREFVIGLITKELERYEAEAAGENRTEAEGAERNTAEAGEAREEQEADTEAS